jgi:hypothetical protein
MGGDGSTVQQSTIATSDEVAAVTFAAGLKPTPGMWARQGLPLVHFSPQSEPSLSLKSQNTP